MALLNFNPVVHIVNTTPFSITYTSGKHIFLVDATIGNIILNLPAAVGNLAEYAFIKTDNTANTVIVDAFGAELINSDTTQVILFQWTTFEIISNNVSWNRSN